MAFSKDDLLKFGREASFKLFADEAPLTSTIIKIASDYDLNPEQVKRVCHAANQSTMLQIYQGIGENTQEFDVAEPKEVLAELSSVEKIAEITSNDYFSAPPSVLTSISKMAGEVSPTSFDFDNGFEIIKKYKESYQRLTKEAAQLGQALNDANGESEMCYYKCAGAMDVLYKVVKQAIRQGQSIKNLIMAAMASMSGKAKEVKEVMYTIVKKIQADATISAKQKAGCFAQLGILKTAEPVGREFISTAMRQANNVVPLKIQNGSEGFTSALHMVYDDLKSINDSDRMAEDIHNKLTVIRRRLGELKPPEGKWY